MGGGQPPQSSDARPLQLRAPLESFFMRRIPLTTTSKGTRDPVCPAAREFNVVVALS